VENGEISLDNYGIISKHIFEGMNEIREAGVAVKVVNLDQIYFKNGYYKIANFPIFETEKKMEESYNSV
jgi:hypothetical protein